MCRTFTGVLGREGMGKGGSRKPPSITAAAMAPATTTLPAGTAVLLPKETGFLEPDT
ncbi:hypothetical protein ABIB48_003381 [Arthrobacter sp. UYCu511]